MKKLFFLILFMAYAMVVTAQASCQKYRQQGIALYNQGNYVEALQKFQGAAKVSNAVECSDLNGWIVKTKTALQPKTAAVKLKQNEKTPPLKQESKVKITSVISSSQSTTHKKDIAIEAQIFKPWVGTQTKKDNFLTWELTAKRLNNENDYEIILDGKIEDGYHISSILDIATPLTFKKYMKPLDKIKEVGIVVKTSINNEIYYSIYNQVKYIQRVKLLEPLITFEIYLIVEENMIRCIPYSASFHLSVEDK